MTQKEELIRMRGAWKLLLVHKCSCPNGEGMDISWHGSMCPKKLAHQILDTDLYVQNLRIMEKAGNTWTPLSLSELERRFLVLGGEGYFPDREVESGEIKLNGPQLFAFTRKLIAGGHPEPVVCQIIEHLTGWPFLKARELWEGAMRYEA